MTLDLALINIQIELNNQIELEPNLNRTDTIWILNVINYSSLGGYSSN